MEPWRTPTLTGNSCEDFLSRAIRNRLLLRKVEIRPNIRPEIPEDLIVKTASMPNPVESLGYIKYYSSSNLRPIWCLFCELWRNFTHCSRVFIVGFEQVNAGWVGASSRSIISFNKTIAQWNEFPFLQTNVLTNINM